MAIKYKDMAIRYKEHVADEKNRPFSKDELERIEKVEKHIDEEILKCMNPANGVRIVLSLARFTYDVGERLRNDLPYNRQSKMSKELDKRYKDAGWKIKIEIDDGLDGPNFSGPDYWVLTGK